MQYALSSVIIFDMYNRIWHQQHNIIFGSRSTKLQKEIILRNILKNKKFDSTQCFNVQSFAFSARNTHNQPFKCDYVQIIENLLLPGKNMHNMHIYVYINNQKSKLHSTYTFAAVIILFSSTKLICAGKIDTHTLHNSSSNIPYPI